MNIFRTKFKGEIVAEFVMPKKPSNKVLILCGGMPGYPEKSRYESLFDIYTKKGFWIFVPRYRGSWESGGLMFKKSPHKDIQDVIDELETGFVELWAGQKYVIKNPEIVLVGGSFGGPAVLLNSKDSRVKKVIAFSPVLDWREEKNTIEPIPKLAQFVSDAFACGYRIARNGWQKIEEGKLYNPATEQEKIDGSKCLIIHAKDDEVVSAKPLESFVKAVGPKLILVAKGGHMGSRYLVEKRFSKKCSDFLKSK